MTDTEILDAMKILMKPIHEKLDDLEDSINLMRLEQKRSERKINQRLDRLEDEMETLIAVLEAKDIIPKAN